MNVYYKLAECDFKSGLDSKWYLLKYENTTKENIELNFHKLIYEGDVCKTCDYPKEYSYSVFLESNQVKAGKCLKNLEPAFYVFSDFIDFPVDNPTLKFELANFKVTKHRSQK